MASTLAPHPRLQDLGRAPHQPLVLGVACVALGLSAGDAALAALHESVAGPVAAALRLLALDPIAAHELLARMAPTLDELVSRALDQDGDVDQLPAGASPLLDVGAEQHATRTGRLFAS